MRRSMVDQSDISMVAELRRAQDVTALAATQSVDVVITEGTIAGVPAACQQLLFGTHSVTVIAVNVDGRLEIYDRRVIREAGIDDLLTEIRRVANRESARRRA